MPQTETVIYPPPKSGLPFLVVTLAPDGLTVLSAESRTEARTLIASERRNRKQKQKEPKNGRD